MSGDWFKVVQTEHVLPTPWAKDEAERERLAAAARADFRNRGGLIVRESRVRNVAFDKRGAKTTYKWTVDWPDGSRP